MLDELLVFSEKTTFDLFLLRKQPDFYQDKIVALESKGVNVVYLSGWKRASLEKIIFSICFFIRHILCFLNYHSFIYGIKAIIYFLKTDEKICNTKDISIHAQFATQTAILATMFKIYYSKKKIEIHFTFHAYDIFVKNRWFKFLVNNSEKAFSISHFNITYVCQQYKVNPNKIAYSPLGVFSPSTLSTTHFSDTLNIGFMSFFVEMKGLYYLLPAIKTLKEKGISLKLHIAGDGPLKDYINTFIQDNNLHNHIICYGLIKNDQKENFFKILNVFLLPSISKGMETDGLPVVLMEAVSYGVPIISTNISGIPEICIDEFNGYLIEQRNINSIVKAVEKFIKNRDKWSSYKIHSLEIAQNYNIIKNSIKKLELLNWA